MDDAQRKKLEAGKKRLEEFRKKKDAQEAAANAKSASSSAHEDGSQNSTAIGGKHTDSGLPILAMMFQGKK